MGTVVERFIRGDSSYGFLYVDDGSGTLSLRAWREDVARLAGFEVGDLVDAIGRVREYAGEVYLVPDLIVRVRDPNWELVRELEILRAKRRALIEGKGPRFGTGRVPEVRELKFELPPSGERAEPEIEEVEKPLPEVPEEVKKKALLAFEKFGGSMTQAGLAAELNLSQAEAEEVLRALIVDGEIFEPKAGRFKRLG